MSARYGSEERALARAETLRQRGTRPGVIRHADGMYGTACDPQDATTEDE